jgi:hypothetical protein
MIVIRVMHVTEASTDTSTQKNHRINSDFYSSELRKTLMKSNCCISIIVSLSIYTNANISIESLNI